MYDLEHGGKQNITIVVINLRGGHQSNRFWYFTLINLSCFRFPTKVTDFELLWTIRFGSINRGRIRLSRRRDACWYRGSRRERCSMSCTVFDHWMWGYRKGGRILCRQRRCWYDSCFCYTLFYTFWRGCGF